jgi:hypothetical protein
MARYTFTDCEHFDFKEHTTISRLVMNKMLHETNGSLLLHNDFNFVQTTH